MKARSTAPMRIAKIGYIIMSCLLCAVGLVFIIWPEFSSAAIGKTLGVVMILFGIIKLIGYFSKDLFRLAFQYDLQFGILLIALGVIVLMKTKGVMNFIFVALGICILADGLFKIQIALDSKKFGIKSWWLTLVLAILTGIIGLVLVFRPTEGLHTLTILLGISLLAEGVLNLCVAVSTVRIVKNQQPDVIEVSFRETDGD